MAAARSGDRSCLGVLGDVGALVGRALAGVGNLLDPGRIVIGGPLSLLGDLLLDPVRTAISRYSTSPAVVVPAAFEQGAEAAARGGAALILQEAPQFASVLRRLT